MKKKILLIAVLALCMCLLTGCVGSEFFGLRSPWLESLFGEDTEEAEAPAETAQSDTVTISREEYEQYQQFNELIDLIDFAESAFYKDTDREKMLQYAAKGLMAGLEDPYSFYYTPEEWESMWEDDEGEYEGIGVLINANYKTGICTIIRVFKGMARSRRATPGVGEESCFSAFRTAFSGAHPSSSSGVKKRGTSSENSASSAFRSSDL